MPVRLDTARQEYLFKNILQKKKFISPETYGVQKVLRYVLF